MDGTRYLCTRKGRYYFRRRVPGFSTCLAPVMVALGTTDHTAGFKLCVQLTAHMDRMLDENTYNALSEEDVAAFFKAELCAYLARLRKVRLVERMDGSLTAEKARRNHVEAIVLRGLVEDGLREEMDASRLNALDDADRDVAQTIQSEKFKEFVSAGFNHAVQQRAGISAEAPQFDRLRLRWAAVEARMAAHEAVQTVPLHRADAARDTAIALLAQNTGSAPQKQGDDLPPANVSSTPPQTAPSSAHRAPLATHTTPTITEGVTLIKGRMTGHAILEQLEAAHSQPKADSFDGTAHSLVVDRIHGADIAGTAVRMNRRSNARKDTQEQKLKSVALFMYLTGIQLCSDIRQSHLDLFAQLMRDKLPPKYWKSRSEKQMTSVELLNKAEKTGATVGLSPSTIERHLNTLVALITHARMERNIAEFTPNLSGLIPRDTRTSAEKREVFTFDDMQRVFAHSVWQGSKTRGRRHIAGNRVIKDHHYWISLLIAYTGARRSEIAGLLTTEVGSEDGIPFVSIQVNHLRGLKNSASKRRLPLHPHLIELGFLEFVEQSRKRKKLALFEEAVPAQLRHLAHVKDDNFAAYDKKFGDALDHMFRTSLEHSLDGNPRGLSCHGMRHYVNDFLINLRNPDGTTQVIPEMDRLDILGHTSRSENSRTYRRAERPLGPLYAAIKQLPYLFGGA